MEYLRRMIDKPIEVNQRLTASYGSERVKGGKGYNNPTIEALIKADFQAEYAKRQLDEILANRDYAVSLINMLGDTRQARALYQFYVMARTVDNVALNMGCHSPRWADYLLQNARKALTRAMRNA